MTAYSTDRAHEVNATLYLGYVLGWKTTEKQHDRILMREPGYAGKIDPNSRKEGAKYKNHGKFVDNLLQGAMNYLIGDADQISDEPWKKGDPDMGWLKELSERIACQAQDPEAYVTRHLGCKHSLEYLRKHLPDNPTLLSEAVETALAVELNLDPEFHKLDIVQQVPGANPLMQARLYLSHRLLSRTSVHSAHPVAYEMRFFNEATSTETESVRFVFEGTPDEAAADASVLVKIVDGFPNIRLKAKGTRSDDGHICVDILPKHGKKIELCELSALSDQLEQFRIDAVKKYGTPESDDDTPPPAGHSHGGGSGPHRWN